MFHVIQLFDILGAKTKESNRRVDFANDELKVQTTAIRCSKSDGLNLDIFLRKLPKIRNLESLDFWTSWLGLSILHSVPEK